MPVVIGNEVGAKHKAKFVIEVKCMHGDADAYSTGEIVILAAREDLVEEAMGVLKQMDAIPWNDRREGYEKMSQWRKWFSESDDEDVAWGRAFYEEGNRSFDWPGDSTCDFMYRAALDGWKLFYYDENGKKFTAKVVD